MKKILNDACNYRMWPMSDEEEEEFSNLLKQSTLRPSEQAKRKKVLWKQGYNNVKLLDFLTEEELEKLDIPSAHRMEVIFIVKTCAAKATAAPAAEAN